MVVSDDECALELDEDGELDEPDAEEAELEGELEAAVKLLRELALRSATKRVRNGHTWCSAMIEPGSSATSLHYSLPM